MDGTFGDKNAAYSFSPYVPPPISGVPANAILNNADVVITNNADVIVTNNT